MRVEATGLVRSTTPDLVIRHADYLNVWFQDVPKLLKPPKKPEDNKKPKGPTTPPYGASRKGPVPPRITPKGAAKAGPPGAKNPANAKAEPKKDQKIPFVVIAKSIEAWVNRDPDGNTEIDHVKATGDVEAHQAPPSKDKQGNDVAGQIVEIQAYSTGDKMVVTGDSSDKEKLKYAVVRSDKLTIFGFHIMIDQRNDTGVVNGAGQMEILSTTDAEGKKLDKPSTMFILWTRRMDFFGADKLIYYHGGVQAYQDNSRCYCEWMQVLLDRPVYLDPERRDKAKSPPKPGVKEQDDNAKIDTIMCFHAPKDENVPKPKTFRPVTMVEETREKDKLIKLQSVRAPDIVIVNTPIDDKKARHEMIATASRQTPGECRIWQPGSKDAEMGAGGKKKDQPKTAAPPRKKGELGPDEEMKLTIVQFGEKMWAEDFRKRAKFWTNVRVVHLPADRPNFPVNVREGEIPKGAIYLEARDTLEVFTTVQREKNKEGKDVDVEYQEMIAIGNVKVRKQDEFLGDADKVTYSEMKGTLTFHGTDKNPASIYQILGQGIPNRKHSARTLTYYLKTRTVGSAGGTEIKD